MINFMKDWKGRVGDMEIKQSVQPTGDGEALLVLTGMHGAASYHVTSSTIPFEDHEKLGDDAFRTEIARRDLAEFVARLRRDVEFAEKALAAPVLAEPFASMTEDEARTWHIRRDERNGRHTP